MTEPEMRAGLDELEALAQPLVEYLRKKHHPHAAIVVTDDRAVLVEELMGIPFRGGGLAHAPVPMHFVKP